MSATNLRTSTSEIFGDRKVASGTRSRVRMDGGSGGQTNLTADAQPNLSKYHLTGRLYPSSCSYSPAGAATALAAAATALAAAATALAAAATAPAAVATAPVTAATALLVQLFPTSTSLSPTSPSSPSSCSYSPAGAATALAAAATALAAAATALAAAATAPAAVATAPVTAATALLVQLQPLLLPLQPLLLPPQPLLLQLQPCWCSYSPCCCRYSPCCCRYSPFCCRPSPFYCSYSPCCCCYSPCCCRYSPCCCRSSPCYCSYSPAGAATALAAAATALAAAAAALAAAATALAAAAAGGGAAGSAGSAAGAGGAGGATGSAGGVADAGAARGGQKRSLPLPDDPTPQQLREWVLQRARPGGGGFGFLCTAQRRQESQQETFSPQVLSELFPQRCVTGSVEAAALGACESTAALGASESAAALGARASPATGPSSAEALHTFTLDTGASRCFFHDCTSLTPLAAPVPVSQAGPTGGPVVAQASTVLPCPAVPSGSLSGLHLPTFSTNLVSNAAIQDVWVDTFIPGGQRVVICTCSRTGRHLAMFTRRPGSSSYTLTTASAQVAAVGQVAASSQVSASSQLAASCSCRVLSHQTLLWHHRLGHPSLPRLRGMHSRLLVSGLPRSLPSLPRSPAPPCLPCVKGRQRAAPHSSEFPPTTAPLQTLHMDVWGPAPVGGTDQERYFPLVVEDYSRYTNVFPLWRKADVSGVLIPWIRATRCQLCERFSQDFPVLRLHSDRGGGFSSDLLAEFCRDEGIVQSFTLPASPRQNGIAKRRIGLIMEVVHTCMVHAATPHFLWPFAVRYAAHQLNLRPRVSEPETSPTLRWTGKVGDASVFRFNHPRSRRVFSSQDVTFDESVYYYRLHPHASHPVYPDSSGPAEGGDPAADDTVATRCSPRLETPPGLPPRPSSPPRSLLLWTLELRLLVLSLGVLS
ncbi:unnamed protein product [Closterium sp. NIES-53]